MPEVSFQGMLNVDCSIDKMDVCVCVGGGGLLS